MTDGGRRDGGGGVRDFIFGDVGGGGRYAHAQKIIKSRRSADLTSSNRFLFGSLVIVEKLPVLRRVTLKRSDPGT